MRILHVHSGNLYGGVETILVTLAHHRDVCPSTDQHFGLCFDGRLSRELAASGVPVHSLGAVRVSRPQSVWRSRRALARLLRAGSFDLVVCHSSWSHAIFGTVARSVKVPLVLWLHGVPNGRHWLERWARLSPPDAVLCNSRFTESAAAKVYPGVRREVVYCPVEAPAPLSNDDRRRVRTELDTAEDATVIIQVSRMEPLKGHAIHLEALSQLRDLPGWTCWQVGGAQRSAEAQHLERLRHCAERLGIAPRVRFLGERSDVSRLLGAADIYCQPNTDPEAFGLTFVEALFAGLPLVSTTIGGAREIIADHGCGILVPANNTAALAVGLRGLIENPALRAQVAAFAAPRARQLADVPTQLKQLERFFGTSLISSARSADHPQRNPN